MTLGKRIKFCRENNNLTQKELAELIDVSNSVLSNYERDFRDPSTKNLRALALVLNVTTDFLLGFSNAVTEINNPINFEAIINDKELHHWWKNLPNKSTEELQALKKIWEIIQKQKKL